METPEAELLRPDGTCSKKNYTNKERCNTHTHTRMHTHTHTSGYRLQTSLKCFRAGRTQVRPASRSLMQPAHRVVVSVLGWRRSTTVYSVHALSPCTPSCMHSTLHPHCLACMHLTIIYNLLIATSVPENDAQVELVQALAVSATPPFAR